MDDEIPLVKELLKELEQDQDRCFEILSQAFKNFSDGIPISGIPNQFISSNIFNSFTTMNIRQLATAMSQGIMGNATMSSMIWR